MTACFLNRQIRRLAPRRLRAVAGQGWDHLRQHPGHRRPGVRVYVRAGDVGRHEGRREGDDGRGGTATPKGRGEFIFVSIWAI